MEERAGYLIKWKKLQTLSPEMTRMRSYDRTVSQ